MKIIWEYSKIVCNDHEDACKNGTFKEKLESVNVKSYVFNFGLNAVKNESECVATDNYDKGEV